MRFKDRILVDHPNIILETMKNLEGKHGFIFTSQPESFKHHSEWGMVECDLESDEFQSSFNLQQMPGCCAVLVVSYVKVWPLTQARFDRVLQLIEEAAKEAGFGSVAMTQVVPKFSPMFWQEEPWILCIEPKRGWLYSKPFVNAKSGNAVVYLTKDLKQPGKRAGLEIVTKQ